MSARVFCSVPGCLRWSAAETMASRGWAGFVCGSHWRRATKRERSLIARIKRRQRKVVALTGEPDAALARREWVIWAAIERRVAERPPVEPR